MNASLLSRAFIISDTHFDHANIIRYCQRPFADVREMNAAMRRLWNATVAPGDTVYFLGDLMFKSRTREPHHILRELNGNVVFIRGNHDHNYRGPTEETKVIEHRGHKVHLAHYPGMAPEGFDGWSAYGHVHNNNLADHPFLDAQQRSVNVGVELLGYKPLDLDDLVRIIENPRTRRIEYLYGSNIVAPPGASLPV